MTEFHRRFRQSLLRIQECYLQADTDHFSVNNNIPNTHSHTPQISLTFDGWSTKPLQNLGSH